MALPRIFAAMTTPVMSYLDEDFAALGVLTPIPCTVSGTNTLTLTPIANTPTISAYATGLQVSGVVGTNNSTAVTAAVGALAALNVYKDTPSGPAVLIGNEMVALTCFTLRFDSALNSGTGGWHLINNTSYSGGVVSGLINASGTISAALQIARGGLVVGSLATVTRILTLAPTLTFTVVPANTNQTATFTLTSAAVNDVVTVGPPASVVVGTSFMGYVPAAGTVAVVAINSTAASLTPTAGIYRVAVTGFT